MFSDREQQRYQRHLQLAGFGEQGQRALQQSTVCIVGLGGLGCPAAMYLAAAGVGELLLVDGDTVSLSNLQRQVLFCESDVGENKAEAARRHLAARNGDIRLRAQPAFLDVAAAEQLFATADLVLDCTDNFHTRYLINDVCHALGKPWVYASVLGFDGQFATFGPGGGCFRCLFPELGEVPDCNQAGVLGAVPGALGSLQALQAIRYLANLPGASGGRLHLLAGQSPGLRAVSLAPSPDCVICSGRETYRDRSADYSPAACVPADGEVEPAELEALLRRTEVLLVDVRGAQEHRQDNLGGRNVPLAELQQDPDRWADELQGCAVLLYCQGGVRSARAASLLREAGLTQVMSLRGGIAAVRERG